MLRGYGARNLIVVGGDGLICLGTTVIDAMYRNYRVIALRDGVITNEYPETKAAEWASFMAIRQIETTVGYTITTEQFIAACDGGPSLRARQVEGDDPMTDQTLNITGRYYRYYPWDAPLGEAEDALSIPLDETVFLLVDVYGQAHGEGFDIPADTPEFYRPPADDPVGQDHPREDRARQGGREAGRPAGGLRHQLPLARPERGQRVAEHVHPHLRRGRPDEWIPPTPILEHAEIIAPQPGEPVVKKQMYSGFFETNLDSVLRGYGAKYLVAVGFDSRICFGTTVTDAMYRDYRVIALRDAIYTTEFPRDAGRRLGELPRRPIHRGKRRLHLDCRRLHSGLRRDRRARRAPAGVGSAARPHPAAEPEPRAPMSRAARRPLGLRTHAVPGRARRSRAVRDGGPAAGRGRGRCDHRGRHPWPGRPDDGRRAGAVRLACG